MSLLKMQEVDCKIFTTCLVPVLKIFQSIFLDVDNAIGMLGAKHSKNDCWRHCPDELLYRYGVMVDILECVH